MSIWCECNPNPCGKQVGDCAVRAIAIALDLEWHEAYIMLCDAGYEACDLPNSDAVWSSVLRQHGFRRHVVPDSCPDCYNVADFAYDHPNGIYVLGFSGHVATIIDGILYDSWDSSCEIPIFYWSRED